MKTLAIAFSLLFSGHAMATGYTLAINCEKAPYTIELTGAKPVKVGSALDLIVRKDGVEVGKGPMLLVGEGYESSMLNAYVWAIESEEKVSSFGLAIADLKEPLPGKYQAFADFFVSAYGHDVDGSTVPCEVTIR